MRRHAMTGADAHDAASDAPAPLPTPLDRRFEAVVVRWPVLAGREHGGRGRWPRRTRRVVLEELCRLGLDLAIISDLDVNTLDAELGARPRGPGRLLLCAEGGSDIWQVAAGTPVPLRRIAQSDWLLTDLWSRGVAPTDVLMVGVEVPVPVGLPGRPVIVDADPVVAQTVLGDQRRRRLDAQPPIGEPAAEWSLTIDGFDHGLDLVRRSLLTIADGELGTSGSSLVEDGGAPSTVLHEGLYTGAGPATELASLPSWALLPQVTGPHPLRTTLDLHTGLLYEEGPLRSVRFACLARPGTVVLRAEGDHAHMPTTAIRTQSAAMTLVSHDVRRGQGFERFGAYDGDPGRAAASCQVARELGFEALLHEQREAWARRWQEADIRIDGDPELQGAIRFALFHLMASVGDRGEAAVGARGLSGPAYRGHVFWDSDVFVLPYLAATHPQSARAMLEYRVRGLGMAREAATRAGREGAEFPWESAADGVDVTPRTVRLPSGELIPVRTHELEAHIVADVAWSVACYLDWSADAAFAAGAGREILIETARYWASRVRHDRAGRAHIDGVMGPDEYHGPVDDDAFTNVLARWNLRRAAAVVDIAADERSTWLAIADALVDGYDRRTGLYEQHAGFFNLDPMLIADASPQRPVAADALLGAARITAAQVVKQPDVLMLHHLVPDEMVPGSLPANLDFYEPRTAHGSSLSPAVHAALLARAGRFDEALLWLRVAARIDLDDITGSTAGGLHLATMGGLWQALVAGFAGIRAQPDCLRIDPRLPPHWRSLHIGLRYRGEPLRLHITASGVDLESDRLRLRRRNEHWEVCAG